MSKDILTTRNVSHTDSLGRTPDTRLFDCGLPTTNSYGENLENGANDPTQIMYGWKIDTPKNDVLLNTNYTVGAVSVETDPTGEYAFWTFDAAGPTAAATLPIGQVSPQVSTAPTSTVPSPACLGGNCGTLAPTGVTILPTTTIPMPGGPSNAPSSGANPSGSVNPSVNPSLTVGTSTSPLPSGSVSVSTTPGSGTPGADGLPGSSGNQGIIGLLLAFLLLILKFFMSLFGR
jgi:hypothetical protein